ncbi:MAG TPA: hypothetical protein VFA85_17115 [Terriglobales bacterium]|nr:hypothetical protein [Terriglobales bacterium]
MFWRSVRAGALIVGFNLPFDLCHFALDASWTTRRGGGWSLKTGQYLDKNTNELKEDTWNTPRIVITPKDSKGAFFRSTYTRTGQKYPPIRCADLKTLIWALQSKSVSLDSGCELYRVPGKQSGYKPTGQVSVGEIDYNRGDVGATLRLLNAVRADFDTHKIRLTPTEAFSPASIAKAYLDAMGIIPPLQKFSIAPEILGIAMQAYFGGRAECRIRHTPVPVVYTDFLSQYPTVNTLMDLWSILTAEQLQVEDATDEVRELLSEITLDRVLDREFWKKLRFFALVVPDGDVLPVRSDYNGQTSNIGLNPLTSHKPVWYAGPDVVGAVLHSGERKPPKVLKAFKLVPIGQQSGLQAVKLRGSVEIDPRVHDFFKTVIEDRARIKRVDDHDPLAYFLKILANAGSYGLFVEVNPEKLGNNPKTGKPATAKVRVYAGEETFETSSEFVERPGPWYFPLIGSLITAAGRLLLATLERALTDKDGTYLMCDTDSMAIVASETGGLVPCPGGPHRLSEGGDAVHAIPWTDVQELITRIDNLNPYERDAVIEPMLKVEKVNFDHGTQRELYGYGISAKRYALFSKTEEGIQIEKVSAHGIGYLFPPKQGFDKKLEVHVWVREAWDYVLRGALRFPRTEPEWFGVPAMMRFTINTPEVLKALQLRQVGLPYPKRTKPYSFGLLAITTKRKDGDPITPIAPFTDDLSQLLNLNWINMHDEKPCRLVLAGEGLPGEVEVQTYGWIVGIYPWHPESKSLAPDGKPCSELTAGLLARTPVLLKELQAIAKETDRRWEREEDVSIIEPHRLLYSQQKETPELQSLRQKLSRYVAKELEEQSDPRVSIRAIKAIRNGERIPKPETIAALQIAIERLELNVAVQESLA